MINYIILRTVYSLRLEEDLLKCMPNISLINA